MAVAGGDPLGNDGAACVFAQVNHLGAGVGLLPVVGHGNGVEFTHRVVAHQDAPGIFPGDGRSRLHLRPTDLRITPFAYSTFGDEIVDAAFPVFITRIPVLNSRILHLRILKRHDFYNCSMELIFIPLRRRAPFHVAHVGAFFGDDQGALELSCIGGIDPEIGGKLHGTTHPLGNITERSVAEYRRVKGGKVVVGIGHHRSHILLHQVGMVPDSLAEGAKDDSQFRKRVRKGRLYRHTVHYRIYGNTSQLFLFVERNTQFTEGGQQFRIHLVETREFHLFLWSRVVDNVLEIDRIDLQVSPSGLLHGQPMAIRLQAEIKEEPGLVLLCRDKPDGFLRQSRWGKFSLNVGREAVFVVALRYLVQDVVGGVFHGVRNLWQIYFFFTAANRSRRYRCKDTLI